jgi:hypothetical protein
MRRAITLTLGLLAIVGLAAPASHAAKAKRVTSEVEISGWQYGSEAPFEFRYVGDVHSKKPKCERARVVRIYETTGGTRDLVGTATTDRTGDWELLDPDPDGNSSFVAEVVRKKINRRGKDLVCKPAESSALEIPGGAV